MEEDFSKKYVATGKNREYRTNLSTNLFDSFQLEIKEPDTAVLLLKCKETSIFSSAAEALLKFGEKSSENLEHLFDLKLVETIITFIEHEDVFTRRFAIKLLSQMASIPNVKNYLLQSDSYVSRFSNLMMEDSDIFMQEISSRILAEFTKDLFGVQQLANSLDINFLFELIKSNNPDVKKNCIEIIYNLLQDPFTIDEIINYEGFDFLIIYKLLNEPYRVIQELALDVIKILVEKTDDEVIQEMFRKSNGLDILFNLLDIDEWADIHFKVLNVIALSANNKTSAKLIILNGGIQKLLKYIETDCESRKLYFTVLNVLAILTKIRNGIIILYNSNFVDHLLEKIQDTQQKSNYKIISIGIAQMSSYHLAAKDFSEKNTIQYLIDIARNDKLDWVHREYALYAIKQLITFDIKNCEQNNSLKLFVQELLEEAPLNVQILCVQIISILLQYNNILDYSINAYINILYSVFEYKDQSADELKIMCCDILSNLCISYSSVDQNRIFDAMKSQFDKLFNAIKLDINSLPVKHDVVKLLIQLCENVKVANEFVKNGCLLYMIQNRSPARIIPLWDTCIEVLLNAHLPSKFAYSGRLTCHDITENGFYAMRRTTCPFPDLEEFFKMKMCPVEAIYVVNFSRDNNKNNEYNSEEIDIARNALRRESLTKGLKLSTEEFEALLELRYGQMEADPDLYGYMNIIKDLILSSESERYEDNFDERELINISKIVPRAKILAEFVIRQMSGDEESNKCIDYRANMHLRNIKQHIGRNLIPLGKVKVGSCFERALLYKVLADRIFLPVALVRDQHRKAWIEISVPQMPNCIKEPNLLNTVNPTSPNTILPRKLLKANYIVDLMNYPGHLYPINSRKAKEYLEYTKKL